MKIFTLKTLFGNIHIRDSEGTGAACMMLHGNSQSSEQFDEQFKALGEKYRLIAWDYPGHGNSDALADPTQYNIDTYAAIGFMILKNLGINCVSLFGWSLGGHIAIEMVRAWQEGLNYHPATAISTKEEDFSNEHKGLQKKDYENDSSNSHNSQYVNASMGITDLTINGLIITGTPPCEFNEQSIQQAFTLNPEIFALSNNEKWQSEDARKWVEFSGLNADQHPNAVKAALKTDGKSRTHMVKHLLTNRYNQQKDFENFAGPVAIIVGEKDKHIKPDYMRTVKHPKFFKGGPIFIEHVGHSPFLEDSTTFNQTLDAFLATTASMKSKL